ncbi:MAG: histidine phosphatase family protein [Candidatus Brennerbacteria bacterium]
MDILVARHGESVMNTDGRCAGWFNDELTETGRAQAKKLATHIPEGLTVIFSSPLSRALETARIIADHHKVPKERIRGDGKLMERNFGVKFQKHTWEEFAAIAGHDLKPADRALRYDYTRFGGESVDRVKARVQEILPEIRREEGKKVLVVTHGGIIRILKSMFPYEVAHGVDEEGEMKPATLYRFTI